ncbi:unnamed protein product [Boreogadus saida]
MVLNLLEVSDPIEDVLPLSMKVTLSFGFNDRTQKSDQAIRNLKAALNMAHVAFPMLGFSYRSNFSRFPSSRLGPHFFFRDSVRIGPPRDNLHSEESICAEHSDFMDAVKVLFTALATRGYSRSDPTHLHEDVREIKPPVVGPQSALHYHLLAVFPDPDPSLPLLAIPLWPVIGSPTLGPPSFNDDVPLPAAILER